MNAFLSHISEEASEARAIKKALEGALPGSKFFVSATDIHLGDAWLKEIDEAMKRAKAVLALCSPNSVRRPWLNFESGSGWAKRLPVIPICHKGMKKDQLPDPLHIFKAVELADTDSCKYLVDRLAAVLVLQTAVGFNPVHMLQSLRIEVPPRTVDVGIVLSHQQGQWDEGERSVFALTKSLPSGMMGNWTFHALTDKKAFFSEDLHRLSGLIFVSPWRAKLEPETIGATVEWVRKGGRLLLLGFELGDRHHGTNLAELSHNFGIDPCIDIVGPADFGDKKPYDIPVNFNTSHADPHPFTDALMNFRLTNVQTLRVEPGGIEWLRVGENVVYRPHRDSVQYHDGTMTAPGGTAFGINRQAGWLALAVEAPKGLCGKGAVQMIGTWDLIGRSQAFGGDKIMLISRLLDWLSRKSG
ncbi:MAG: toll/interleukin-1 receptor domain-containing protein [Sedimentisphaerales bacterium]